MKNGVYKSTILEPTIKQLTKETSLFPRATLNLVSRGKNIRAEISLMKKSPLRAMRGCSRYNTITKRLREEIFGWVLSYHNYKPSFVSGDVVTVFNPESNQKEIIPIMLMEISVMDIHNYMIKHLIMVGWRV